jgi:CAAX prenyl protease-like protein
MSTQELDNRTLTTAHVLPFAVFMGCLLFGELLAMAGFTVDDPNAAWFRRNPEHWLYPLQTVLTLAAFIACRQHIQLLPLRSVGLTVLVAVLGIAVWILPGFLYSHFEMSPGPLAWLGFTERTAGFNPSVVEGQSPAVYGLVVAFRFLRLVVAVPLAEEIFWRGFLMRYLINPDTDYWQIPLGTFSWRSYLIVTALFVLAHSTDDYFAAFIYGSLTYYVAVRTKSLASCVLMHAVASLLLGCYVMATQQWGYW